MPTGAGRPLPITLGAILHRGQLNVRYGRPVSASVGQNRHNPFVRFQIIIRQPAAPEEALGEDVGVSAFRPVAWPPAALSGQRSRWRQRRHFFLAPCVLVKEATADVEIFVIARWAARLSLARLHDLWKGTMKSKWEF